VSAKKKIKNYCALFLLSIHCGTVMYLSNLTAATICRRILQASKDFFKENKNNEIMKNKQ
jgi:hypothetical protein